MQDESNINELFRKEVRGLLDSTIPMDIGDICLKEATESLLCKELSISDLIAQIDHAIDYTEHLPYNIIEMLTDGPSHLDNGTSDTYNTSAWRDARPAEASNMLVDLLKGARANFEYRGIPNPLPSNDISQADNPARPYFSQMRRWRSVSAERILFQSLVVWEAYLFSKTILLSEYSLWTSLKLLLLGGKPPTSLSLRNVNRFRNKAQLRFFLLIAALFFICIFATSIPDVIQNYAGWIGGVFIVLAIILVLFLSVSEAMHWLLRYTLFRKRLRTRGRFAKLAGDMVRFGARISSIRSPKEAEAEFLALFSQGAGWPNDAWVLLGQISADHPNSWGYELFTSRFQELERVNEEGEVTGSSLNRALSRLIRIYKPKLRTSAHSPYI